MKTKPIWERLAVCDEVAGDGTSGSQVSTNPLRVVRHILVHELPAVFPNNRIEQIERDIVVVRIARDDLAVEFRLQEILGRSWNIDSGDSLSVVGIRQRYTATPTYWPSVSLKL